MLEIILQIFADASTVVNTIGTHAAPTSGMDHELKEFYDTALLENARIEFYYAQFGKKQPLPANHGKRVEWRKWNTFANAPKLVEGVIPSGQTFGESHKTGDIEAYGTYATISDELELHAYDDVILGATQEMAASAAQTQEKLIRDTLLTGTNVLYADNINGSTVTVPTACNQMGASSTNGWAKFTADTVAQAVRIMNTNRVPKINGRYYCVIHPSVAYDLRKDEAWLEAHKYAAPEELFNGEIGELHGVRFIESSFAPVLKSSGYTNKDGGATYASYMFGKDAFGLIDPAGGALQMIVHDKSEIGGPLTDLAA